MVRFIPSILFCICLLPCPGQSQSLGDHTQKLIREHVAGVMKKQNLTGLSYAVVSKDSILMMDVLGMASEQAGRPVTPQTAFCVGSISKLFTLTAVLKLHEEGRVDLDKPIQTYLPEFSIRSRFENPDITIRNVLTHHSGLPSDYLKGCISRSPMTETELVKCMNHEYQAQAPGTMSAYSNVGFTILGALIEEVTQMPYKEYMEQEILTPLNMARSSFSVDHPKVKNLVSSGFNGKTELPPYPMREVPAGGLFTNVEDMSRFIRLWLNDGELDGERILSESSVTEAWNQQNADVVLDYDYDIGLAWRLSSSPREPVIDYVPLAWHSGGTVLFSSMLIILPEQEIGVVVMNNMRKGGTAGQLANDILKIILEQEFQIAEPETPYTAEAKHIPGSLLHQVPGEYASIWGKLSVEKKGKRLMADVIGRKIKLVPYEEGLLGLRFMLFGFMPVKVGPLDDIYFGSATYKGEEILLLHQDGDQFFFAKKFKPEKPSAQWLKRVGEYEIVNLDKDYPIIEDIYLKRDGDVLSLSFVPSLYENVEMNLPINPLSDSVAVIQGYGRWQGETLWFEEDEGQEILYYSGYRFQKIE